MHGLVVGVASLGAAQIGDDPSEDCRQDSQDQAGDFGDERVGQVPTEYVQDLFDRTRRRFREEDAERFLGDRELVSPANAPAPITVTQ